MAPALHVFTDFDGTITTSDTLEALATQVGAGADWYHSLDREILAGRLTARDATVRNMERIRVPLAEALDVVRRHVGLDPGFRRFAAWCAARAVPLTVLSAGFHEIIERFVPAAEFPHVEIRANRLAPGGWRCVFLDESSDGHDKAAPVARARAAGAWTIFVGDGLSDREPARAAHRVFARRGRYLLEFCHANGIPCSAFDGFDDVRASLEDLHRRADHVG